MFNIDHWIHTWVLAYDQLVRNLLFQACPETTTFSAQLVLLLEAQVEVSSLQPISVEVWVVRPQLFSI